MDRRTVWAILLMMVIAVAPALFLKKPAARSPGRADSLATPAPDTVRVRTLSDTAMARAPNVEAVSAAPTVPEWRTA